MDSIAINVSEQGTDLVFHMDDGSQISVDPRYHWMRDQASWIVAHLRKRLEEFAPGSPDDVPEALDALLDEPT